MARTRTLAAGIALPALIVPPAARAADPDAPAPPPPEAPAPPEVPAEPAPAPPVAAAPVAPAPSAAAPAEAPEAAPTLGDAPEVVKLAPDARARGLVFGLAGSNQIPLIPSFLGYSYSYFSLSSRWSPSIGVSWQGERGKKWNFVPELWYTQFGSRIGSFAFVSDTLSVPFLFRRYNQQHRPITPYFEIGPEVNVLLNTRSISTLLPYAYFYSYSYGVTAVLNAIDLGVRGGFGVSFPMQNTRGIAGVRLYQGIVPKTSLGRLLNRQVSVVGGVYFGRPKKK